MKTLLRRFNRRFDKYLQRKISPDVLIVIICSENFPSTHTQHNGFYSSLENNVHSSLDRGHPSPIEQQKKSADIFTIFKFDLFQQLTIFHSNFVIKKILLPHNPIESIMANHSKKLSNHRKTPSYQLSIDNDGKKFIDFQFYLYFT